VTTAGTTEPGSSEGPLLHRCTTLARRGSGECPVGARSVSKAAGLEASRALQRVLYRSAEQNATRRFHALYCHVARSDILWRAWGDVRANRGLLVSTVGQSRPSRSPAWPPSLTRSPKR
jgi:hypothetical protein